MHLISLPSIIYVQAHELEKASYALCWYEMKYYDDKVKSCYNPLRLGTVIVLVSSGIDFVNTPRLYSDRATR